MLIRSGWKRHAQALAASLLLAAPAAAVVEVPSDSTVRIEWAPATGPVAAYFVYVFDEQGRVTPYASRPAAEPWIALHGSEGRAYAVSVVGVSTSGEFGATSELSEYVRFVAAELPPLEPPPEEPPPEEPPTTEPPPEEPPTTEPPPEEPPTVEPPPEEPPTTEPPPEEPPPVVPPDAGASGNAPPEVAVRAAAEPLDFDDDGSTELLFRNTASGALAAWHLEGGSSQVQTLGIAPLAASDRVVGNADYDGNGSADVAVHDAATGELRVHFLSRGEEVGLLAFSGVTANVVGSGDFDGDGAADLVLEDATTGNVEAWPNLYLAGNEDVIPLVSLRSGAAVAGVADLDGDGDPDLVVRNDRGIQGHELENGVVVRQRELTDGGDDVVETLCDADADARIDTLVSHGLKDWRFYDYSGDDTRLPARDLGLDQSSTRVLGGGHYDGAARCELAVLDTGSARVSVLQLDDRDPQTLASYGLAPGWVHVGVGYRRP